MHEPRNVQNCQADIERDIIAEFATFGQELGLDQVKVCADSYQTNVYVIGEHALQIEIDWRENALYMYAVTLIDGKLPPQDVIYRYADGKLCRKYIEEIYSTQNQLYKSRNRYSHTFLKDILHYYFSLIRSAPEMLKHELRP